MGGSEEQAAKIKVGNPHVKDCQDEAKKIVEKNISHYILFATLTTYIGIY